MAQELILKKTIMPKVGSVNNDIDYICRSFGYFSQRDKQETAGKIFRLIVKETPGSEKGLSSDEIAAKLSISRGSVVHHLNCFISTGLIISEHNKYRLRSPSVQKSIEEIMVDVDRIFNQMLKIAKDIDNKLGHHYR